MQADAFHVGKLPMQFLQTMIERYTGKDERLVVGPRVGEDAAVLDMGDRYLVAKSDPITFATDRIGWYVVHINANDIATMGAVPRWLLLTLLLPEKGTDPAMVEDIFSQASQACQSLGIVLCGGHTEITYGLDRPIAVGLMLGEVEKNDLVRTAGAQVGDNVILTKGIAIEGTAVLANELGDSLTGQVDHGFLARCRQYLETPGIGVVRDAQVVCSVGLPHSMHDPTEGGLATGLWELAMASKTRIEVDLTQVPILPETAALCQLLDLDVLGVMASGALLVTASAAESTKMVQALLDAGIQACEIGRVVNGPPGVWAVGPGGREEFPAFERDELARLFEEPLN